MLVKDAMNKDVKTIGENDNVRNAAERMVENRIGSLVVLSQTGELLGLLTERDILRDVVARGESSDEIKVGEIMTKNIIVISPDATLEDAADVMTHNKIKKLPVINQEGQLIGIITASDLIAYEQKLVESVSELMVSGNLGKIGG